MKKIIPILMCLILIGCSNPYKKAENGKISIAATIFPLYDFARAVCGEKAEISLLIDPGTEVHSFEPKPSDIMNIYNADLFLYIGGESDTWVDALLKEKNTVALPLIEHIEPICEEEHEHGHLHAHSHDEHIWTSPENARLMVQKIAEEISKTDPENSQYYTKNAENYCKKITDAENRIKAVAENAPHNFILVADRFPYKYFTDYFGIEYEAAFGGCAASTDISLKVMTRLVKTVEENNLTCAYYTELSNRNIADALAEETGIKLYKLNSAHNVTASEFESGITYVDLMEQNATALEKGWK